MEKVIKEINELFDKNMWVTDYHRDLLMARKGELSIEKLNQIVENSAKYEKEKFKNIFGRMGNKIEYYNIPVQIFKINCESIIEINCKYKFQKLVGKYKVVISPYYDYEYKTRESFAPYVSEIYAKDNRICIPYSFNHEDMYIVNVSYIMDEQELLLLTTNVYALGEDLFDLNYYKADFHMHTTFSDGYEPPELVVTSARECGMDIIAVTDHNNFNGSVIAKEQVEKLELDMTVILGEEYSLEYSPMHILALGTKSAIDRKFLTKHVLDMEETKRIIEKNSNLSCDIDAYACTQVLLEQVKTMGGISILAHPYWKPIYQDGSRIDTPESLYIELGKDKRFDGIEVVSGSRECEFHVSNLQFALFQKILNGQYNVPIIGITDAHYYSTDPICGTHYTVIFSKNKESENVLESLKSGLCVAIECIDGKPLCFGELRLIKYAEFLINFIFPQRDKIAKLDAMRAKEKLFVE